MWLKASYADRLFWPIRINLKEQWKPFEKMKMISPMSAEEDTKLRRQISISLLFIVFLLVLFVAEEMLTKLNTNFDGSVIASEEVCFDSGVGTKKCYWEYEVLNSKGEKEKLKGGMAGFLEEEITEGVSLRKEKWTLHYYMDESKKSVNVRYGFTLFIAFFFIPLSLFFSRKEIKIFFEKRKE